MSRPVTCTLIVNPTSGSFSQARLESVIAYLNSNGVVAQARLTAAPKDATAIARQLCTGPELPFIVAVGGDGTTNEVINGIGDSQAVLATLPFGTSNVLSRELAIRDEHDALERIVRGTTRPLSLGILEQGAERRYFFLMAGIGFDGAVVAGVRPGEKKLLKQGAYILSAIRCLAKWDNSTFRAVLDGREIEVHSLIVCNAARYGGNFVLAHGANLFEQELQVICIKKSTWWALLRAGIGLLVNKDGGEIVTANHIEVYGDKAIQADGDFVGHAPVTIRAVMSGIRLVV